MSKQLYLLLLILGCLFCSIHFVSAQAYINRQGPITSSEVFGIRRYVSSGGIFPNYFGGMYVETYNSPLGKPFYGYAIDSTFKAYHFYDGGDSGWHLYNTETLMSVWPDSMQWQTAGGNRLFFAGHRLSFEGSTGNLIIGNQATVNDSPNNINNLILGGSAATGMTSGVSNVVIGTFAGQNLVSGDFNTFLGIDAGRYSENGSRNTFIGYWAGRNTGVNSIGNVFLGYRAGQNETGSNKLYIANSETANPLIYGDFNTADVKLNGDAEITGTTLIQGTTTINSQVTSQDIRISDSNPYLEFRQLGNSRYYFQYQSGSDQFVLHETGTGQVLKIKDGEVYFPQLTSLAGKNLKINGTTGKLEVDPDPTVFTYYGTEFYDSPILSSTTVDITKDLINGMTIHKIVCQYNWSNNGSPPGGIILSRLNRTNGTIEGIYQVLPPPGTYNQDFTSNISAHIVDTDNYTYFLQTIQNTVYVIMEVRVE